MKYCPWLCKKLKESPSLQEGEEVNEYRNREGLFSLF
jgi:hypothetical protein